MDDEDDFGCEFCDGSGWVSTQEQVWPGEAPTADIGTERCICNMREDEDFDDQE